MIATQIEAEIEPGEASLDWEAASPQAILRWAVESFGERLTLGTGLGPSGIVLVHMLTEITPDPDLFFLDTNLHFPETYALLHQLESTLGVRIRLLQPARSVAQQAREAGPALWQRDPDLCCQLRKVAPLREHLSHYDAWIAGLRRDQGRSRAATPIVRYIESYGILKINPLATWTREMVWSYINAHDLPVNPLHSQGYPSIGCRPCTAAVPAGEAERAGRWVGFAKVECGLHTA